ncbi:MAG: prolipoprotein diacylglyceryl transferase [Chloroflexota bacterium]
MGIDPIIYTIRLGSIQLPIRWYGLLIVAGAIATAYYAAWYVKRRGKNPDLIWDAMVWLLISGIIGARAWYVINDLIGGNTRYLDDPAQIVRIDQGGLNILGGFAVGIVVLVFFCRRNKVDFWLLADGIGPGLLLGQAIGRLGNYINQELYGPPTSLPWGIQIDGSHRLSPWDDLTTYPVDSTFFHPTFAYEAIWNLLMVGLITYYVIQRGDSLKSGTVAGLWFIAAGVGRVWIEFFRPDQPSFFGAPFSTSTVVSVLFAVIGILLVMIRNGSIKVPFMAEGSTHYAQKSVRRPQRVR